MGKLKIQPILHTHDLTNQTRIPGSHEFPAGLSGKDFTYTERKETGSI